MTAKARRKKPKKYIAPGRRVLEFPQVQGKIIEAVEFSTSSDAHSISLRFQDKTALAFDIEPGFTVMADYADWKTGNWRPIKRWPLVRSQTLRV